MKRNGNKKNSDKGGFALIFVMILMTILAILGVGSMARGRYLRLASLRLVQDSRLDWRCDAGLEEAELSLWNGNHDDFTAQSGALVTFTAVTGSNNTYRVRAKAVAGGKTNIVEQTMKVDPKYSEPSLAYNIMAAGTSSGIATNIVFSTGNNADITGSGSIGLVGSMSLGKNVAPDSGVEVWLTGGSNVAADNIHTNQTNVAATNLLNALALQMGDFSDQVDDGGSVSSYTSGPLEMGGQVIELSAPFTFSGINTITGSGTLIIPGNLTLANGSTVTISDDVTVLVGGNFTAENNCGFDGNGNALYVRGSATFENNSTLTGAVLIGDELTVVNRADFTGLVYVDGHLEILNNANLIGAVIADSVYIKNNG